MAAIIGFCQKLAMGLCYNIASTHHLVVICGVLVYLPAIHVQPLSPMSWLCKGVLHTPTHQRYCGCICVCIYILMYCTLCVQGRVEKGLKIAGTVLLLSNWQS